VLLSISHTSPTNRRVLVLQFPIFALLIAHLQKTGKFNMHIPEIWTIEILTNHRNKFNLINDWFIADNQDVDINCYLSGHVSSGEPTH
jgi:hypothetical protein